MKFTQKPLFALYVFVVMLFTDVKLFAQPGGGPGDDSDEGIPLEDEDPALPISGKLIWLIMVGLLFAAYKITAARKHSRS